MSRTTGLDFDLRELSLLSASGYYIGVHIRVAAPLMIFSTYKQEWVDWYTEQGYALRDPTIAWGFSTTGITRWSEMGIPDVFGILKEASGYGMKYGVTVSCGPISSRTIASAARDDREFREDEMKRIESLILRLHEVTEPPDRLTQAQIEALRLIAAGDRHAAAANKLKISESALKARITSARQRLMARTTAEAIQRAKDYKLL